ncbi:MAG TPA: flagellar motor switch protein FliN [Polyangiales bacterium]|nr:flagellar motor switch protein FliN [Polyangiales bacterium]
MRDVAEAMGVGAEGPMSEGIERIMEIPLELTVELGRKRIRIGELLSVGVGSVIDLGTAAGAPLSIYANSTLIAHGEAVVVGERYGIRVTDIVSPRERVRRLGGEAP